MRNKKSEVKRKMKKDVSKTGIWEREKEYPIIRSDTPRPVEYIVPDFIHLGWH